LVHIVPKYVIINTVKVNVTYFTSRFKHLHNLTCYHNLYSWFKKLKSFSGCNVAMLMSRHYSWYGMQTQLLGSPGAFNLFIYYTIVHWVQHKHIKGKVEANTENYIR